MTVLSWNASCKPIYSELKMTVPSLLIFKHYETFYSDNFKHEYNTELKNNFQYPIHSLELVQKTPSYIGRKVLTYCL